MCHDIRILETYEGLFVSELVQDQNKLDEIIYKTRLSKLASMHLQTVDFRKLDAAENDFKHYSEYKRMLRLKCSNMLNTIRNFLDRNDFYLYLNDMTYNEIMLYINEGVAFVPKCRNLTNAVVTIVEEPKYCTKDIEIKHYDPSIGKFVKAYLRPNGVITRESLLEDCQLSNESIAIDINSTLIVKRVGNMVRLFNNSQSTGINWEVENNGNSIAKIFAHNEFLLQDVSIMESLDDFMSARQYQEPLYYSDHERKQDIYVHTTTKEAISKKILDIFDVIWRKLKTAVFFVTIIGSIGTIVIFAFSMYRFKNDILSSFLPCKTLFTRIVGIVSTSFCKKKGVIVDNFV